jgi:hypothetical protein
MVDVSKYPAFVLPAGTALFHGSDCAGEFLVPDGPAWFAFSLARGAQGSGWSETAPTGRIKGERRVLAFRTGADIPLIDTRKLEIWEKLCADLTGDPETGSRTVAFRVWEEGIAGWYGQHEVLLAEPANWLVHRAVHRLEQGAVSAMSP